MKNPRELKIMVITIARHIIAAMTTYRTGITYISVKSIEPVSHRILTVATKHLREGKS